MTNKLKNVIGFKVKSKVVVVAVIFVVVIGLSFVLSSLLPQVGSGKFYSSSGNLNINIPPPVMGYCVTSLLGIGGDGEHTSQDSCTKRGSDNNPNTNWYLFCPDPSGKELSSCDCTMSGVIQSGLLSTAISSRDSLINDLNDGQITMFAPTTGDWTWSNIGDFMHALILSTAAKNRCACSIRTSGNDPNDPVTALRLISLNGADGAGSDDKVVFKMLQKYDIMRSKMMTFNQSTHTCVDSLPTGCRLTSSYRGRASTVNLSSPPADASPHDYGVAIDLACGDASSSTITSCTGTTNTLLKAVLAANPGFNVISECTATARQNCGTTSANQVVHVDLKDWGNRPAGPCYFDQCTFTTCGNPNGN